MGNITTLTVFVWTINILVFIGQLSMLGMNPDSNTFYNPNETIIAGYVTDTESSIPNQDMIGEELNPSSSSDVEESSGTGIFFIDIFASVKNWVQNKLSYIGALILGPFNIINAIPASPATKKINNVMCLLWVAAGILTFLSFIFGRSD